MTSTVIIVIITRSETLHWWNSLFYGEKSRKIINPAKQTIDGSKRMYLWTGCWARDHKDDLTALVREQRSQTSMSSQHIILNANLGGMGQVLQIMLIECLPVDFSCRLIIEIERREKERPSIELCEGTCHGVEKEQSKDHVVCHKTQDVPGDTDDITGEKWIQSQHWAGCLGAEGGLCK